jgi:hypothetical protein
VMKRGRKLADPDQTALKQELERTLAADAELP